MNIVNDLKQNTIQQLKDIGRMGAYNYNQVVRWNEEDVIKMSQDDSIGEIFLQPSAYNQFGKLGWHYKRQEIRREKDAIKYSGRFELVDGEELLTIQEVHTDETRIKIIGNKNVLLNLNRVNTVHKDMTDEEFMNANKDIRDELHKIDTYKGGFNRTPDEYDINGVLISNIDHYDNYQYYIENISQSYMYEIYNMEAKTRRDDKKLEYLEEKLDKYQRDILPYQFKITCMVMSDEYQEVIKKLQEYSYKNGTKLYEDMINISKIYKKSLTNLWRIWKHLKIPEIQREIKEIEG